ncbi:hypothetical protein GCM10009119_23540 [Algoriphagus jejuensis]|uniref:Uncharacterized protein n=1 Tax=Algoriphagus jejuensis TaxID=419934 RepID=A0ABP3YD96_9BACT
MRKPEQELAEIKSMMERSTRFLSLSGLAGVLAGIFAMLAAAFAYYWIYFPGVPYGLHSAAIEDLNALYNLLILAFLTLIMSVGTTLILSQRKSKRKAQTLWTPASRRFVEALFLPVLVGGIFCLAIMIKGHVLYIAPVTLIFYGLGLINAAHFTLGDIKYLGFCQLGLGIIAAFFPEFGLLIWTLGFGVMHIVYGTLMHLKYDR